MLLYYRIKIVRELKADYIMVVFGGASGYVDDDLNKLV